jgi:hypothetical protein
LIVANELKPYIYDQNNLPRKQGNVKISKMTSIDGKRFHNFWWNLEIPAIVLQLWLLL